LGKKWRKLKNSDLQGGCETAQYILQKGKCLDSEEKRERTDKNQTEHRNQRGGGDPSSADDMFAGQKELYVK